MTKLNDTAKTALAQARAGALLERELLLASLDGKQEVLDQLKANLAKHEEYIRDLTKAIGDENDVSVVVSTSTFVSD